MNKPHAGEAARPAVRVTMEVDSRHHDLERMGAFLGHVPIETTEVYAQESR